MDGNALAAARSLVRDSFLRAQAHRYGTEFWNALRDQIREDDVRYFRDIEDVDLFPERAVSTGDDFFVPIIVRAVFGPEKRANKQIKITYRGRVQGKLGRDDGEQPQITNIDVDRYLTA